MISLSRAAVGVEYTISSYPDVSSIDDVDCLTAAAAKIDGDVLYSGIVDGRPCVPIRAGILRCSPVWVGQSRSNRDLIPTNGCYRNDLDLRPARTSVLVPSFV